MWDNNFTVSDAVIETLVQLEWTTSYETGEIFAVRILLPVVRTEDYQNFPEFREYLG